MQRHHVRIRWNLSRKSRASSQDISNQPEMTEKGQATFGCRECQLVSSCRTLGYSVAIAEDVWMKLSELERSLTYAFHPASMPDILCDKSCPDGDCLERPTTSRRLESDAARVLVTENAECMQVPRVCDLSTPH